MLLYTVQMLQSEKKNLYISEDFGNYFTLHVPPDITTDHRATTAHMCRAEGCHLGYRGEQIWGSFALLMAWAHIGANECEGRWGCFTHDMMFSPSKALQ